MSFKLTKIILLHENFYHKNFAHEIDVNPKHTLILSLFLSPFQDFGYPQSTSTEVLKSYICNSPCPVTYESRPSPSGKGPGGNTLPSHAANKPIATSLEGKRDQKNEVFIDLLERLTVLVAANVSLFSVCTSKFIL